VGLDPVDAQPQPPALGVERTSGQPDVGGGGVEALGVQLEGRDAVYGVAASDSAGFELVGEPVDRGHPAYLLVGR